MKTSRNPIYEEKRKITIFENNTTFSLLTSRFTTDNWEQNRKFRQDNNIKTIYGTPVEITKKIPYYKKCLVLEMNNQTNRLLGIGLIENYPHYNKYRIYKNSNDRYIYKSNKHYPFNDEHRNSTDNNKLALIIEVLEQLCFHGNEHLKRGSGLQMFPTKYLYRLREHLNIIELLGNLFHDS